MFAAPPYGWPREAVDAAMPVLANGGQIKMTGPDGKPALAVNLTATQFGTRTIAPETRFVSANERLAVCALGQDLGSPQRPATGTITRERSSSA